MARTSWKQVLDTLYELGGYGEWPHENTEDELDDAVYLSQQLDLDTDTIDRFTKTLDDRGLADVKAVGSGDSGSFRWRAK